MSSGAPLSCIAIELLIKGFPIDPLGAGRRHGSIELRQLLHDDVLAVLQRDGVLLPVDTPAGLPGGVFTCRRSSSRRSFNHWVASRRALASMFRGFDRRSV